MALHPSALALLALVDFVDPEKLLATFGTIGLFAIVFAESGLLFGFFLPGDSLLFTAGLLASQGKLSLPVILVGCFVAAVAGDQVGYAFGNRVGPSLFRRPDSRFFKQANIEKAQAFFDRHGSKTIVLARFVPVARTFVPIVAGVGSMSYRTFVTFNVVGGLLWAVGITLLGYILGETVPNIDKYLLPAIGVIVVASAVPVAFELLRARRRSAVGRGRPADP
ncbi:MAG: VTT domain-containing protein [Actinomycetota bacterium]|nr:VTT domain-containing protein [Actinomycetota bacterium]